MGKNRNGDDDSLKDPAFEADFDEELLHKAAQKKPEVTHLIKRLSVETRYREWLVERIVEQNGLLVESARVNEEILTAVNAIKTSQEAMARAQSELSEKLKETDKLAKESAKTIMDWTIRFKSPLTLLGALFGMLVTAAITLGLEKLFHKP